MAARQSSYLFYAEIPKGYIFKSIIDLLAVSMQKTTFVVTNDGLYHCNVDDPKVKRILIDVEFSREKFKSFECPKSFSFSVNLKHLKTVVKNVKKKVTLIIYILAADPNKMYIYIKPAKINKTKDDKIHLDVKRVAKNSKTTVIDHVDISIIPDYTPEDLPEYCAEVSGTKWRAYEYPKVVDSSDFLQIKKMVTPSKELNVVMRGHEYISFYSSASGLFGSQVTIGCESDDEEGTEEVCAETVAGEPVVGSEGCPFPKLEKYEAQFNMRIVGPLMKLPSLSTQMQFYAPLLEGYPLKVRVDAGGIATTTIYIKDIRRIELEESNE